MRFLFLLLALPLAACGADGKYADYLRMRDIPPPTTAQFIHCYDYGCMKKAELSLPAETRKRLAENFKPAPKTPEQEREKVKTAIKIFEDDIGAIVGTKNDKRGTFRLYQDDAPEMRSFQQDCIDESTNTTIYLGLLEQMRLLKFHRPVFPANRQPFLGGAPWWHQTAVMKDLESGEKYAVDSWFRDNGHPAFVVPLQEWKDGWLPPKPAQEQSKDG